MRNLRDDVKSFRPKFNSALSKSTIRKTSQANDAKAIAERFEKQTGTLLDNFKKTRKGDADVPMVLSSAQQLDEIISGNNMPPQVTTSWQKIQTELQQVSNAFGVSQVQPYGRQVDNPDVAGNNTPCVQAVGEERSKRLVEECLAVSPATHPPCNARNSCVLIIDEIKRGCAMLGRNAPSYCEEYR